MSEIVRMYPRLVVTDADAALEFYGAAFGATVLDRYADEHGQVAHAMVAAGPVRFAVKDADEVDSSPADGGSPVIIALYVTDADAVADRMAEAGATVVFPVADHDYGQRGGRLRDPFGHLWMIAEPE
ncbi:VOC family protein [Pseudonocardia spinosispora]|uniref:VOC family protein n=1 Tax=Pseudonocardia spinosispora TaxID=103441 RepID=UPI00048B015E|nr:VOC family protein [Pseudonocardia spinosispora]